MPQNEESVLKFFIQALRLLRIPEHVMVSPKKDLAAGKSLYKRQILPALGQLPPPGVIPGEHKCILRLHDLPDILLDLALMVPPHSPEFVHGFVGLKAQMQISQCVKRHKGSPPLSCFCLLALQPIPVHIVHHCLCLLHLLLLHDLLPVA